MIPLFLFIGIFLIYKNIYQEPRNWYDHYLYLANSLLQGRVDIPELPEYYQDKIIVDGKTFIPFPPGAALLLMPFIVFAKTLVNIEVTQQQVSVLMGAVDIVLIYFLLQKFANKTHSLFLSIFLALGTPFFWSSIVGTTWFFGHVSAIFFLTLSLIFHYSKKDLLSGIFFALAALTRIPMVLAGVFYLLQLLRQRKRLLHFLIGSSIWAIVYFGYNYARFENFIQNGYKDVYYQYTNNTSYPFTLRQLVNPKNEYYGYLDLRNVPMHLYTFLVMPPDIEISEGVVKSIKPSPYGMGILFTSPLLFLALFTKFKKGMELNLAIAAVAAAIPNLMHYMQGWVQFGYRFVLDFIVFLLIILAVRFKLTKLNLALLFFSVIVNYWGVIWAIKLGW